MRVFGLLRCGGAHVWACGEVGFSWGGFTDDGSVPGLAGPMEGRCDSITRSTNCVNDFYTPTLTYSAITNPLVGPVAQHVFTAEQGLTDHWGNPYIGQPLYYDSNDADQAANRRAACSGVTSPSGFNCDEYPMASTSRGPRSRATTPPTWCRRRRTVRRAASTGYLYFSNHVLDGPDPFWVKAILSNGASSW